MTKEEAISELKRRQHDLWFDLRNIAELAGISLNTIYIAIRTGYLSNRSLARLTGVLRGTTKEPYHNYCPPYYLHKARARRPTK